VGSTTFASLTLAIAAATTIAGGPPSTTATTDASLRPREPYVVDAQRLAGLRVTVAAPTFRRAVKYYGPLATDVHTRFSDGNCDLTFVGLGLKLFLARLDTGLVPGTPATCNFFIGAEVTSRAWRTSRGLRIGSTVQTLRRLYPSAYSWGSTGKGGVLDPPRSIMWVVADETPGHAAHPVLTADVRHARVISLGISIFGH
jgi:hypothetical protein